MQYEVYGPFEMKRDQYYYLSKSKEDITNFWQKVENEVPNLAQACGCYIFTINDVPFYVGQTKRTFKQETFNERNKNSFDDLIKARLRQKKRGKPYMYFVAKCTKSRSSFAKPPSNKKSPSIDFLENLLISRGYTKNKDIINMKNTKMLKELEVPGVFNSQKKTSKSAKQLKKVLE